MATIKLINLNLHNLKCIKKSEKSIKAILKNIQTYCRNKDLLVRIFINKLNKNLIST